MGIASGLRRQLDGQRLNLPLVALDPAWAAPFVLQCSAPIVGRSQQ